MYQRVTKHDFIEAFRTMGRLNTPASEGGNFTYEALVALFDYLEDYEENVSGDAMELDVIGLCCDFAEYEDAQDAADDYMADPHMRMSDDRLLDWFRDRATVIEIPGTDRIIIQQF